MHGRASASSATAAALQLPIPTSARISGPSVWDSSAALMAIAEALLAAVTRNTWELSQRRMRDLEQLREQL